VGHLRELVLAALKAKFEQKSAQQQLKVYAKHFVISNVEDDEEPWEEEYQPDGKYIPRVIFTSERRAPALVF
jgi:hypothetical protein